jgi:hypothetical protein
MNEEDYRSMLLTAHRAFVSNLIKILKDMSKEAFNKNGNYYETEALRKLFKETASDIEAVKKRMDELLVSEATILTVVSPLDTHTR